MSIVITGSKGVRELAGTHGPMQAVEMPPTEEVAQAFGAVYTLTSADTRVLRLFPLANCWIAFAKAGQPAPTAASPNFPAVAEQEYFVWLAPGDQIVAAAR